MSAPDPGQAPTVVLLDPLRPDDVPAAALALLRGPVSCTPDVPDAVRAACTVVADAPVLVSSDETHPQVLQRREAGAAVLRSHPPTGSQLLEAVAVMDRLRSPGGCPWDAEQTHDSLRRYLVEECYELLDALDSGAPVHVVEELGDVLLQVLFHARVAAEQPAADGGFDIDDVARALVVKLVHRHPHVFADPAHGAVERVADSAAQQLRWEELKAVEKRRDSAVEGVATGQPALALAAKLVSRATRAGLPADLVPAELAAVGGGDAEDTLRRAALRFAAQVRAAEDAARGDGVDPAALSEPDWRRYWAQARVTQPNSVEPQ
ncbi:MazG family protein [Rhodococcus sp. X156]|uniref:MazG family protein n=1 Tax=Rhodococcus sp. X156 TaxID=2499145 RepID=UPI000FD8A520|nr:MazG family protein [Rhodococcus sp. X156]